MMKLARSNDGLFYVSTCITDTFLLYRAHHVTSELVGRRRSLFRGKYCMQTMRTLGYQLLPYQGLTYGYPGQQSEQVVNRQYRNVRRFPRKCW